MDNQVVFERRKPPLITKRLLMYSCEHHLSMFSEQIREGKEGIWISDVKGRRDEKASSIVILCDVFQRCLLRLLQ